MTSRFSDQKGDNKPERKFSDSPYPQSDAGFDPEMDLRIEDSQFLMLPQGRPPKQDDCVLHGSMPDAEEINIVVTQAALDQIQTHCKSDTRVELGGVLLGRPYLNNRQIFLQIEAAIPASTNDNGPVHFTFTADAWAQIHVDRSIYPELEIVGWFHTHPDLGVFYSADDEIVHAAAFTQPWHVGLVVDPVRNQASFFAWDGPVVKPLLGFYELIPANAGSDDHVPRAVVDWDIVIDKSWLSPISPYVFTPGLVKQDGKLVPHPMLPLILSLIALAMSSAALYFAIMAWRS